MTHGFPANAAYDLTPLPGESIMSSLWRFAWRNSLRAKELLCFCSRYVSYDKESPRWMQSSGFEKMVFVQSSGWAKISDEPKFVVAKHVDHVAMWWDRHFRYCPVCLEHCYHSFWHQNLFITHCPLDGAPLSNTCYCCGKLLPAYGFHYKLLDRPYTCEHCRGPVAGVAPLVASRLQMQERIAEIGRTFLALELWWELSRKAREEFELLFGERPVYTYSPWLRVDTSVRQWVLDRSPVIRELAMPSRTIPELVVFTWRVQLAPPDPLECFAPTRIPSDVQLDLARQVYKLTLRCLVRAIQAIAPFDDAEHRRHLALAPSDLMRHPSGCNMYLVSLVSLRRQYETYFSLMEDDVSRVQFKTDLTSFGSELQFGRRIRIYWRLRFLAEYGAIYWCLIALRNDNAYAAKGSLSAASLETADIDYSAQYGAVATGSMAFPAIDGFDLRKLARRLETHHL